jgi:protein gp37
MPTNIEWTQRTWNPVTGCTKVSPACKHCYAETMHKRLTAMGQKKYSEPFNIVRTHADALDAPLHWRKPSTIFVNSMSDLFHEDVPDEFIDRVFAQMAQCWWHTFQVLTKRSDRMCSTMSDPSMHLSMTRLFRNFVHYREPVGPWPLPNVWLGVSAENQEQADKRIPKLMETPAAVRFASVEPMLGAVSLRKWLDYLPQLNWVIVGTESGRHRRPTEIDWIRSLRDQCEGAGVSFFLKQMDVDGRLVKTPELDGRQWLQFPQTTD